ncbi:hypothetical protein JHK82_027550 [Glycine max]|uniref:Uncharacterized protein n=2 Tax=Glycine subgen. Soja TaxID=1462606 RepID=A0A0R0I0C2_SOYBN|nr:hypothetical protein JHK87_027443 [Glycine soja]KAG4996764.1 hypothetical protein JHK85_028203 [Glycine max]KAG5003538.1 hypothetical protein JHK86_027677 [Glycine max]KAG5126715.1 hypothetical protein JHK82_027550 [Glycine max]KAG5151329.1 hypothetical protein JHK84_027801 [Glycine max]
MKNIQPEQLEVQEMGRRESALGKDIEQQPTLLEEYQLRNKSERSPATYISSHGFIENSHFPEGKEALNGAMEELKDGYIYENGKLVVHFLQAIHAAEKRQADLDVHVSNEQKKLLKKLKDVAARELMLAEEAAMLDRELKRERAKASLAIKALRQKMEDKLKTELEQKEIETDLKLKQTQELAKAYLNTTIANENAAIANENAAQIQKMAEANVNVRFLLKSKMGNRDCVIKHAHKMVMVCEA